MGKTKNRSGTRRRDTVVEALETRQLLAATVANFAGGNGTSSVDQYTGIAGGGWATAWTTDTYKTTSTAGVLSTNPLNGGGNYLSGTFTGGGTPSLAAFARAYNTVAGGVDTGQAHTISFDVRVDSDLSTFADNQDRINLWGDDSLNYGTTSGSATGLTWVLTAYGAATNGVPVAKNWTWQGGDRAGNYGPILDTGIPLVQGHVYHVTITNDPVSQSYVGAITDLQTSATNTSPVLGWRTGHAFTSSTNTYLMVGGEKQASSGKTTTIATDSISIAPAPPAAPSALTATAASSSQINLAWTDNAFDESGFTIDRATNSSFSSGLVSATLAAGATSYSSTGLSAGTTYYYRVRATNGAGSSANSNTASAATQAGVTVPNAPSNLAATAASATQINLTWTDNSSNETGFKIDRATSSTFTTGLTTATVGAGITTYSTTGLTVGSTYYFRVRATNSAGDSANSNTASARTASPNAPSNLSATAASSSQINLAWTDNSTDETGFKIDRATNSSFTTGLTTATAGAGMTTYAATGLTATTTYYFRVRATNSVGNSANSNTASSQTSSGPAITAITPSTGEADLQWMTVAGAQSYQVYRSTSPNFSPDYSTLFDDAVPSNSYVDNQVVAGTTYYYQAYAIMSDDTEVLAGSGSASTPTTDGPLAGGNGTAAVLSAGVSPLVTQTLAPTNLTATGINDLEIFLSWTRNTTNETGFTIQAEPHTATPNPTAWQTVGQVKATVTTFTARSALLSAPNQFFVEGQDYDFRVQAVNGNGSTGWSNTATGRVVVPSRPQTLIIIGGHTQTAQKLEESWFAPAGQGFSVGTEWKDLIKKGYNVFMSPESGWDGSVVTYDGHGDLYGELGEEIRRGHAGDIGLIGYSHGGGTIYSMSQDILSDRQLGQDQSVIFTGTIDAVNRDKLDDTPPTPLTKSPGAIWNGSDNINYYETYGEPLAGGTVATTCRGQNLPGATNFTIATVNGLPATHDNIYSSPTVISGIEQELIKAFGQSSRS